MAGPISQYRLSQVCGSLGWLRSLLDWNNSGGHAQSRHALLTSCVTKKIWKVLSLLLKSAVFLGEMSKFPKHFFQRAKKKLLLPLRRCYFTVAPQSVIKLCRFIIWSRFAAAFLGRKRLPCWVGEGVSICDVHQNVGICWPPPLLMSSKSWMCVHKFVTFLDLLCRFLLYI